MTFSHQAWSCCHGYRQLKMNKPLSDLQDPEIKVSLWTKNLGNIRLETLQEEQHVSLVMCRVAAIFGEIRPLEEPGYKVLLQTEFEKYNCDPPVNIHRHCPMSFRGTL